MLKMRGKVVTIIEAEGYGYRIKEMGCNWTDDMFEEKANDKKIVITTDGTETIARLYEGKKVVKTATAKCSPDDTFDFETGARLAYDRLMGDEPQYYNGKVVCVKAGGCYAYTVGKIYEFKDGRIVNDRGLKSPLKAIKTLDEWHKNKSDVASFIPLVEETKGENK